MEVLEDVSVSNTFRGDWSDFDYSCACGCLMILCHAIEVYITNTFALRGNNVNKIDVRKNSLYYIYSA